MIYSLRIAIQFAFVLTMTPGLDLLIPVKKISSDKEAPIQPRSPRTRSKYSCQIPANPPGKNFRVAVIYVKLADDTFELGNFTADGWPQHQIEPNWKNSFLIDTPFDSSTALQVLAQKPGSLTAYFYQMSGGNLWLFGNEITYTGAPLTRAKPDSSNSRYQNWVNINTQVIQWFANNHDLTRLDNDVDGFVDMILLVCRARSKFGYQGIARLPINTITTNPGQPQITPVSGIYQTDCYTLPTTRNIVAHEIGHCLGFTRHENGLHRWCLMSGTGPMPPQTSGVTMSAFEKHQLGWLRYETIDSTTLNIELPGLTQSNRALSIPIKNSKNYLVIENRQYSSPFEPVPTDSESVKHTLPGTGLLVYYVYQNRPYIIPADGVVAKVQVDTGSTGQVFYNGDNTDLFGNDEQTEISSFVAPGIRTNLANSINFAIKNIRYAGGNFIFDVYFRF